MDELPRSSGGKLAKGQLREERRGPVRSGPMSVAFITGAGRGQGRAHARHARPAGLRHRRARRAEGADHAAVRDRHRSRPGADLRAGARGRAAGHRRRRRRAPARPTSSLRVQVATRDLGGLDVAIANAGICSFARFDDITDEQWDEMQAVNLGGVFRPCGRRFRPCGRRAPAGCWRPRRWPAAAARRTSATTRR